MAATGLIMNLLGMTVAILIWVAMFVPEVGKVFEPFYNVINELWKMKS